MKVGSMRSKISVILKNNVQILLLLEEENGLDHASFLLLKTE